MGCGASAQPRPSPQQPQEPVDPIQQVTVTAQPIQQQEDPAPKQVAREVRKQLAPSKFQIKLAGDWKDYDDEEDRVLKRAYLVGLPNAKFSLRGQNYEYSFPNMNQKNLGSGKERQIRPPKGMTAPKQPLLPAGPMIVIKVTPGSAGTTIEVNDPNNPGQKVQVNVPPGAKPGQKMAVPVPGKGETVEQVQEKQKGHSTAGKVAMGVGGVAAVSGLAVGGVILGDHLTGGAVTEAAATAGAAVAEAVGSAADAIGDGTAAEAAGEAAAAAGAWTEGAAEDVAAVAADAGEAIADFGSDAIDWLGDAAEDVGDFVMDLF
mmetsp:Transcript_118114/g.314299  ORF Transcript_118114/g.314299 Transcript_118114/m.314299 type:complete len:318 (-) Transcript_118114:108-1061(-)